VQRRRDGRYVVRWREQGRQHGRVFPDLADARKFNLAIRADLANGRGRVTVAVGGGSTLGAWWDQWAAGRATDGAQPWTDRTAAGYRLSRSKLGALAMTGLRDVTTDAITRWQGDLRREGLAESTIRVHVGKLACCLAEAVEAGVLVTNPAAHRRVRSSASARAEAASVKREDIPSPVMLAALGRALPAGLQALVLLCAELGLRSGEARGLAVGDLDVAARMLYVRRQLVRPKPVAGGGGTEVPAALKTGKTRDIELTSTQVDRLAAHITAHTDGQPDSWVLQASTPGQHLDATAARMAFRSAARAARWPARFHLHSLRHAAGSELLALGLSPLECADILGHRVETFLRIYAKLTDKAGDRRRAAMAQREAAIAAAGRPVLVAVAV
jgi:site-specific recombinase XerC